MREAIFPSATSTKPIVFRNPILRRMLLPGNTLLIMMWDLWNLMKVSIFTFPLDVLSSLVWPYTEFYVCFTEVLKSNYHFRCKVVQYITIFVTGALFTIISVTNVAFCTCSCRCGCCCCGCYCCCCSCCCNWAEVFSQYHLLFIFSNKQTLLLKFSLLLQLLLSFIVVVLVADGCCCSLR